MASPAFVAGDFRIFDVKGFKPRMTKEAYLSFQRGIARTELFDGAK